PEVLEREQRARVVAEVLGGLEQILQLLAQLGRLAEGGHAGLERVVHQRERARELRRARLEVARHRREAGQEGRLHLERLGGGRERWRALLDRLAEGVRVA